MWVRHITPLLNLRVCCKDLWSQILPKTFGYDSISDLWPHLFASSSCSLFLDTPAFVLFLSYMRRTPVSALFTGCFFCLESSYSTYPHGSLSHMLQVFTQLSSSHEAFPIMPFKIASIFSLLSSFISLLYFHHRTIYYHLIYYMYLTYNFSIVNLPSLEYKLLEDKDLYLFIQCCIHRT